jgi:hypothetical protein
MGFFVIEVLTSRVKMDEYSESPLKTRGDEQLLVQRRLTTVGHENQREAKAEAGGVQKTYFSCVHIRPQIHPVTLRSSSVSKN